MVQIAKQSSLRTIDDVASFTPLLDWGTMEHPALAMRLFIS
jgi:urease accessory protein UreF